MLLSFIAKMKSNTLFACFLLVALLVHSSESSILDEIEKIVNHALDVTFLRPFADLLDPRNIIKAVYLTAGQKLQEIVRLSGADNAVVKAATATAPELIQMHGYPVEVHTVVTKDGYIIDHHRIPHGRHGIQHASRGSVLIPPSVLCSSACWVILGPGRALPYLLADLGFDVWLSNIRGNTYGRKHQKMNPNNNADFWDYSFHEVGMYDFPATIDYILQKTHQQSLFLIAHSSSTTSAFIMLAKLPEYNKKIKAHFSLTPAAYLNHVKSPLLYFLAQFVDVWKIIVHLIGSNEFLPKDGFITRLGGVMCTIDPISQLMCMNSMFVLTGFNRKSINETHIPIIYGHTPAGSSLNTIMHYGQLVRIGPPRFEHFNHGVITNLIKYKTVFPPPYKLNRITTPMYCFYGLNDWLVSEKDAMLTCREIPGVEQTFAVQDPEWSHNDFIFAMQAKEEVYDKIIEILQRYA